MKEKIIEVLKRIGADIKQYKFALLGILAYYVFVRNVFHTFCPQLILIGIPCAGCGLTRGCVLLLQGKFIEAVQMHPAAPLWLFYLLYFLAMRYGKGSLMKRAKEWLGVLCLITFAIYIYRMQTSFPGNPPMMYHRPNIVHNILIWKK